MFARLLTPLLCAAFLSCTAAAGEEFRLLRLDGHILKWGTPELGTPATITYRLVERQRHFAGAINCEAIVPITPMLARNGIGAATYRHELERAFEAWSKPAGIDFVAVATGPADILIGAQARPRGRAFANVAFDETGAAPGLRSLRQSLICLNPERPWKVGFDEDLDVYDLRYVLMHEIGHAIGLNHPPAKSALMHFGYHETFRTLQPGDIAGVTAIYGVRTPSVAAKSEAPDVAHAGPRG